MRTSLTEARTASTAIAGQWAAGWHQLRTATLSLYGWVMAAVWATAITVDALSTILMMHSGDYEEANSVAATGMNALGMEGYVALASGICAALALPTLTRPPRQVYALTVWTALTLVGLAKLWVALGNVALAHS